MLYGSSWSISSWLSRTMYNHRGFTKKTLWFSLLSYARWPVNFFWEINYADFIYFFKYFLVWVENLPFSKKSPYPGKPALSMMFARVTSFDQTSNCHFLSPRTPQWTLKIWNKLIIGHKLTELGKLSKCYTGGRGNLMFLPLFLTTQPAPGTTVKNIDFWHFDFSQPN